MNSKCKQLIYWIFISIFTLSQVGCSTIRLIDERQSGGEGGAARLSLITGNFSRGETIRLHLANGKVVLRCFLEAKSLDSGALVVADGCHSAAETISLADVTQVEKQEVDTFRTVLVVGIVLLAIALGQYGAGHAKLLAKAGGM